MKNRIGYIFATLALVLSLSLSSTSFAQASRNIATGQCGPNSKSPKCGLMVSVEESDAQKVWTMLGIEAQELDIPRSPGGGVQVFYSKPALDTMEQWEIEETENLSGIVLTRIDESSEIQNALLFTGASVKNRAVYVVKLETKTARGTKAELRIIAFEQRGTISQMRIFSGGRAYQDVESGDSKNKTKKK